MTNQIDPQLAEEERMFEHSRQFMYNPAAAYKTTQQVIEERSANKIELLFPWQGANGVIEPMTPKTYAILHGRPAEGKTQFGLALALSWADQAQIQDPKGIVVFAAWEPRVEEIVTAAMLPETGVTVNKMLSGRTQWGSVKGALRPFVQRPLFIFSNSATRHEKRNGSILNMASIQPGILDLDRALDQWGKDYNVVAVVIDYLQMAAEASFPNEYKEMNRVARTSSAIKMLGDKHDCAVLALAQSKADVDDHRWDYNNGLPRFGDIQWSSKIGQDADRVFAVGSPIRHTGLIGERYMEADLGFRPGTGNKRLKYKYEILPNRFIFSMQKQRYGFPAASWVLDCPPDTLTIQEIAGLTDAQVAQNSPY